jgi:hypothetical protein
VKFLKLLILLLLLEVMLYLLTYIVLPYEWLYAGFAIATFFVVLLILYADKILLFILGARQSVETLHSGFFQRVRHLSFKLGVPTPRAYVYKGKVSRIFALNSRGDLSLVFEYKLIEQLNDNELDSLICYLLLTNKCGGARRRTISYLFSSLFIKFLYFTKDTMNRLFRKKELSRAATLIVGLVIRPFITSAFQLSFSKKEVQRIKQELALHMNDLHFLRSAITKLSYRSFNRDMVGNTLLSFCFKDYGETEKFVDIFEVFPSIESGIVNI